VKQQVRRHSIGILGTVTSLVVTGGAMWWARRRRSRAPWLNEAAGYQSTGQTGRRRGHRTPDGSWRPHHSGARPAGRPVAHSTEFDRRRQSPIPSSESSRLL